MVKILKTTKMKVADLRPHPKNGEIYGYNEDISDLVERIRQSGQVHTLVIDPDHLILAGHRRCRACKELGIKEVDVEIREFDCPEEEIEFIINDNHYREKTVEQKAREARVLKELARDIVANRVGLKSEREAERAIRAVEAIDKLKESGRSDEADLIRGVLNNRSVSAAEDLARNIDKVKIPDEEIPLIKQGKKSPNKYLEKSKSKNTSKVCITCGEELPVEYFRDGRNECRNCRNAREEERRLSGRVFRDAAGNELKINPDIMENLSMPIDEAIATMKNEPQVEQQTDYVSELQLLEANIDDFIFASQKIADNIFVKKMPFDCLNMYSQEVMRLSQFLSVIQKRLEQKIMK